jgi:hypothetical protein
MKRAPRMADDLTRFHDHGAWSLWKDNDYLFVERLLSLRIYNEGDRVWRRVVKLIHFPKIDKSTDAWRTSKL